jgi:molybdate transport system substrate-binding protein
MSVAVISSKASARLLPALLEHLMGPAAQGWSCLAIGGVDAVQRIRAVKPDPSDRAEHFDIAVLEASALAALEAEGHVLPGSYVPLVISSTAVAVARGAVRPDVSSLSALQEALAQAPSIGYSTGPSGRALLGLLERWGMLPALNERLVQAPPGVPVARLIAQSTVAIGFQQLSELLGVDGVDVLGPMPEGARIDTEFGAAVVRASVQPAAAARLIDAMASAGTEALRIEHGFALPKRGRAPAGA